MNIKILFLDIDGVLNSEQYAEWCYTEEGKKYINEENGDFFVDKNAVKFIEQLCENYNVRLVISSSWREISLEATKYAFDKYKDLKCLIKYIVGITPKYHDEDSIRGNEIHDFLIYIGNTNVRNYKQFYDEDYFKFNDDELKIDYCIVDDDDDMMQYQQDNFIKIDNYSGITKNDIKKIKQILNIK